MGRLIDIVGQRFGRLVAMKRVGRDKFRNTLYLCQCDCGNQVIANAHNLRAGTKKSCGCISKEKIVAINHKRSTHKLSHSRLYGIWRGMIARCYNTNNVSYYNYGYRGVVICDEWRNDFKTFHDWAYANGYKEEVLPSGRSKWTIDRIDVNGDYEPSNCRWVTMAAQAINKKNTRYYDYKGESMSLKSLSLKYGIPMDILSHRLRRGESIESALETPIIKRERKTKGWNPKT